jgi:hypothetical protein
MFVLLIMALSTPSCIHVRGNALATRCQFKACIITRDAGGCLCAHCIRYGPLSEHKLALLIDIHAYGLRYTWIEFQVDMD